MWKRCLACWVLLCGVQGPGAQTPAASAFKAMPPSGAVSAGVAVRFTVFNPLASACGVEIQYGDGTSDSVRLQKSETAAQVMHAYAKPGEYQVVVSGKVALRGFNTLGRCEGEPQAFAVQVDAGPSTAAAAPAHNAAAVVQSVPVPAAVPVVTPVAAPVESVRRIALVIGNSNYPREVRALPNARNDARDMAAALQKTGFDVTLKIDLDADQLKNAVVDFEQKLAAQPDSVALFYFSGHGVQHNGQNYLLPAGRGFSTASQIKEFGLGADTVVESLAQSTRQPRIIILDACRTFAWGKGSTSKGLAIMPPKTGYVIAFAALEGSESYDDSDLGERNSRYTKHLLQHLQTPGLDLAALFNLTRRGIMSERDKEPQLSVEYSLLTDPSPFYFIPPKAGQGPVVIAAAPDRAAAADEKAWRGIASSSRKEDFDGYLKAFPRGQYAGVARARLRQFDEQARLEADRAEGESWAAAQRGDTSAAYTEYLKRFPRGQFADRARSRQRELEGQQSDRTAWRRAEAADSEAGYQDYLLQFPGGEYAALATARSKAVALRRDQEAWTHAAARGTEVAYKEYLDQFPLGTYSAQARERIATLRDRAEAVRNARAESAAWQRAERAGTQSAYESYLGEYPSGQYVSFAQARLRTLREAEEARKQRDEAAQAAGPQPSLLERILGPGVSVQFGRPAGQSGNTNSLSPQACPSGYTMVNGRWVCMDR